MDNIDNLPKYSRLCILFYANNVNLSYLHYNDTNTYLTAIRGDTQPCVLY